MAGHFKLRHFCHPSILRQIDPGLLVRFLEPFADFFKARGLVLGNETPVYYDFLAGILMSPDENTPDALLDALFFIDELSTPDSFEDLRTEAVNQNLDLGLGDHISPADLAVRVWLANPDILESLHAERFLIKPKSFQSFLSTAAHLPEINTLPAASYMQAAENDLNDWFETRKRGRGTRIFSFLRKDGLWFLIRHGQPFKREGAIENGQSASVYYRPEKFDVLVYHPDLGELAIHAGTKGEKLAYCRCLGKHVFGSDTFFDTLGIEGKLTLEPIIEQQKACLCCRDIEGIEEIRLVELQFRHDVMQYHVEVHRADDVLNAMEQIGRIIPHGAKLLRAGFRVKFADSLRPRTVIIRPPNVTIFDRESDGELLSRWMNARGFVRTGNGYVRSLMAVA